ncbi:cytochrome c biogenesis protein [Plebeiibacterium sediminum]|uniref:Cytochrome c biogenesis protein CcsA n=1 Tax=Plebeiibacterium sediminum TaxID=2992112 RepID=A0AAE3SDV0_9BACT|nr:cytochrome c biogenesis protein CcsA [Plebeiobacterium sediminum]MCW3785818.1 cytochrome c biogenesis protein CcsA [Plebeiobacterium sediminum]
MKKILKYLSAPYLFISLLIILAVSMGLATFVENDFGTNAAKALIYNTWWFEFLFVFLGVNLLLNVLKPYMYAKGKLAILIFHLSFLIIVIGAAITRYVGYEGIMHIREGQSTDEFLSAQTYISGKIEMAGESVFFEKEVFMSEKSKGYFSLKTDLSGKNISIKSVDYIEQTSFIPQESEFGNPYVTLVISEKQYGRQNVGLFLGEKVKVGDYLISFGEDSVADFCFYQKNGQLMFTSKHDVSITNMAANKKEELDLTAPQVFKDRVLYTTNDILIVQTKYLEHAELMPVRAQMGAQGDFMETVVLEVDVDGKTEKLFVSGNQGALGETKDIKVGDLKITVSYGAKVLKIPFKLHLNEFQLDRYPGSESPSSFASEVTLLDEKESKKADFRIFMNNILSYKGYRFYQSYYDKDEKGTFLSVNKDYWGTTITYTGYLLMAIFMLLSLVASKSRFRFLTRKIKDIQLQKKSLILIGLFFTGTLMFGQDINDVSKISQQQAEEFGQLWVQDHGGRIKPMNSMNGEILRKLVKHNTFKGYSADWVVLNILVYPELWDNIPMITIKTESIKQAVGNTEKKAAFNDFFTDKETYKLGKEVDIAYRTRPSDRTKEQNDLIKIDEQVNVYYMAKTGKFLHLFPLPNDKNSEWVMPGGKSELLSDEEGLFVRSIVGEYLNTLKNGDHTETSKYIGAIKKYQQRYGADVLPGETVKKLEILYNKSNIFLMIAPVLFIIGVILLLFQFVYLFLPHKSSGIVNKSGLILTAVGFLVCTVGLAMRWYISGHAPWSNSYESMLYIAWSMLLAGLIFAKKSPIVLSVAAIFSGIVLLVSHLTWMNPEITPLVPVLKSYWLTIHVAVIVASYGFLGLGAFLAFFNLILIGLRKSGDKNLDLTIVELSAIIEMGLTVGLYLMTIGSFLGGVWANESWGRYWGWDPKETWSLVTIIVYAVILHLRFIPYLKDVVTFNIASLLGFFSILMTYLGVNYYLAGMHSYAKGDPVPIPSFVYYLVITILVVVFNAWYHSQKSPRKLEW